MVNDRVVETRWGDAVDNDGVEAEQGGMCSMIAGAPLYQAWGGDFGRLRDRTTVVSLNNY